MAAVWRFLWERVSQTVSDWDPPMGSESRWMTASPRESEYRWA